MLGLVVSILIGAAILGIIIAVMEKEQFPGWGPMVMCVLAAALPPILLSFILPANLHIIGTLAGAVCATFAIAALCNMAPKRAAIAAGIYFVVQVALGYAIGFMYRG